MLNQRYLTRHHEKPNKHSYQTKVSNFDNKTPSKKVRNLHRSIETAN